MSKSKQTKPKPYTIRRRKINDGPPRNKDGSIATRIGRNEMGDTPMEQWAKNFPHLASKLVDKGNQSFNMGWNSQYNSFSQNLYSFGKNQNPSGISYNRPKLIPPPPPSFRSPESEPIIISSGSDNNINMETSATPFIPSISVTGPWYDKAAVLGSQLG